MKWVIMRPGGLSNKTPEEMGNVVVRGEDQLFGRPSDPGAPHALQPRPSLSCSVACAHACLCPHAQHWLCGKV